MWKIIYLAGGCFWGNEAYFKKLKGVLDTEVGYANGNIANPTYHDLKAHIATHAETVKIVYDDLIITINKILEHFLRFVDPYSIDHQGEDFGHQYRTGVYYNDPLEKEIITNYLNSQLKEGWKIEVLPLSNFYPAEDYHQDYLDKNPNGYCHVNLSLIKDDERK